MPQYVLVSFCNLPTLTTSPLLCLRVPDKEDEPIFLAPVPLGYPDLIVSATGSATVNGKVYILFISRWSYKFHIAVLQEKDLTPLYYQELADIKDGHSILAHNNCLYVVSTGTDEVFAYDIKENSLENPRVVWQASDTKSDTHHINSIAEINGEILISAFGPKNGQLWSTASNGYIYNITTGSFIEQKIYHPHSLSVKNGRVYYSNSHMNTFCVVGQPDAIFELPGYTRGIAWLSDERVGVATSMGRRVSKSTGLVANPADPGETAGECSLLLGNIFERKILRKIDLSWFGPEVYEVLVLQDPRIDLLTLSNTSQAAERQVIQGLAKQLVEWHGQVQTLAARQSDLERLVAEKEQSLQAMATQMAEKEQSLHEIAAHLAERERVLSEMTNSKAWKIASFIRRVRLLLVPPNNRRL